MSVMQCLSKRLVLNFGNNFAMCKQIFIIFSLLKRWNFQQNIYTNFQRTLDVLLHYLVKCTARYHCTCNSMFHVIKNDQQTLLQFIDILIIHLSDMPLMMTPDWGWGCFSWYELLVLPLQKPDSVAGSVWESTVLMKDKELSRQLTSGTHICELVCMSKVDT